MVSQPPFPCYNKKMKRSITVIVVSLIVLTLAATPLSKGGALDSSNYSPFSSVSFFGSIDDIYQNPASLPLVNDGKFFEVQLNLSDRYDTSLFKSESHPLMQNGEAELKGIVLAGPIALTLKFSSLISDRNLVGGNAHFNVLSGFDLELTGAYSFFNHLSFGLTLTGGNYLARVNKEVNNYIEYFQNVFFSPFESASDYARFNLSLGSLIYWDNFSIGLHFDKLNTLKGNFSEISRLFFSNFTLSFTYMGNRYSKSGDLNFVYPAVSMSFRGFGGESDRELALAGNLTLQFLKDRMISFGLKYVYKVQESNKNNVISFEVRGTMNKFSLSALLYFDILGKENFMPSLCFTYLT